MSYGIDRVTNMLTVEVYRYNPESDREPYMRSYELELGDRELMVLDVLERIKMEDTSLSYRRSCREGVCGSDGMNINGKNQLACITKVSGALSKDGVLRIRPLPGLPVIRDLVVDMTMFNRQYERVKPYLQNKTPAPAIERLQSPEERARLDGLYECILCGCCTSLCPSFWWNPEKYVGPAGLLQAYRFLADSRDTATEERLADLEDPYSLYRCRQIQNCTYTCPKKLDPAQAIGNIKRMFLARGT